MKLAASIPRIRLADRPGAHGLACDPEGLRLAGVDLLEKSASGFTPRSEPEIAALLLAGYGDLGDFAALSRGLQSTAKALNEGDIRRAAFLAIHLRLPELQERAAKRVQAVGAVLEKYDPEQPRDWHGRWTSEGAVAGGQASSPANAPIGGPGAAPVAPSPKAPGTSDRAASTPSLAPSTGQPSGGRFILAEADPDEDVEVREDAEREREELRDPDADAWARRPRLQDGRPWPEADPDTLRQILRNPPDKSLPRTRILVPVNGYGPILLSESPVEDFPGVPEGYRSVEFYGTPQETFRDGVNTRHAEDGVEQALQEARANPDLEEIWFNRALTTVSRGRIAIRLRPDVTAVYRTAGGYRYRPFESYSPGQDPAARERVLQHPDLDPLGGRFYLDKLLRLWRRLRVKWRKFLFRS